MKKLSNWLTLSLTLLITTPTMPMGAAGRFFTAEFMKKAFSKAMTVAHWGIAAGPYIGKGLINSALTNEQAQDFWFSQMTDADKSVAKFTREELKKVGVNPEGIIIKKWPQKFIPVASHTRLILYSNKTAKKIEKSLAKQKKLSLQKKQLIREDDDTLRDIETKEKKVKKTLDTWAAVVQHESGHIAHGHNDSTKRPLAYLVTPFLTHFVLCRWPRLIKSALGYGLNPNTYSIGKSLLKIPSAVAKNIANFGLVHQYTKREETEADDFVENDPDKLRALAAFFREIDKVENTATHATRLIDGTKHPWLKRFLQSPKTNDLWWAFRAHPHPLKRAQRLEARVQKLEEEEKKAKQQEAA